MENASKALLIAAAVLIVVLLVAFGMRIFNSAETTGDASGASTAISQGVTDATGELQGLVPGPVKEFNEQFTPYLGENMLYQNIPELITKINTSNDQNPNYHIGRKTEPEGLIIYTNKKYDIFVSDRYPDGRIKEITVKESGN